MYKYIYARIYIKQKITKTCELCKNKKFNGGASAIFWYGVA